MAFFLFYVPRRATKAAMSRVAGPISPTAVAVNASPPSIVTPQDLFPAVVGAGLALYWTRGATPLESIAAGSAAGALVYLLYQSAFGPQAVAVVNKNYDMGVRLYTVPSLGRHFGDPATHITGSQYSYKKLAPGWNVVTAEGATFVTGDQDLKELNARLGVGRAPSS